MKIKCKKTNIKDFDEKTRKKINYGSDLNSSFGVEPGHVYEVFGMRIMNNAQIDYLVDLGHRFPSWLPYQIFEVEDPSVPDHWEYANLKEEEGVMIQSIISYKEMVEDPAHHDAVCGHGVDDKEEFNALAVFNKYKNL